MKLQPNKPINQKDPEVWNLFNSGYTKGVFQLESQLGRQYSKKLGPNNMEQLSALIAVLRPGVLQSNLDGKSLAQHYIDRLNKKDEVTYIHPSVADILEPTYGVLIYQEQSMLIAKKIAGFTPSQVNKLRKGIGKKKAEILNELEVLFVEGCANVGMVDENTARTIFDWMKQSARYLFNKSHSVSYAFNSYASAYYKYYKTKKFFKQYMSYEKEHEEIKDLVSEAKIFNIEVKMPHATKYSEDYIIANGYIYIGLRKIKGLTGVKGEEAMQGIADAEKLLQKPLCEFSWFEILLHVSTRMSAPAFKTLCTIGFFSTKASGVNRNTALYEYEIFKQVNKKELEWVQENEGSFKTLKECIAKLAPRKKDGGGTNTAGRNQKWVSELQMIDNPPYSLEDRLDWIVTEETKLIGCPISIARIDTSDTSSANSTCRNILDGKQGKNLSLAVNITRFSRYKLTKGKNKGKEMGFLTVEDETCSLENVVIFVEALEENGHKLYEGNNVMLIGNAEKDDGSFVVNGVHQI